MYLSRTEITTTSNLRKQESSASINTFYVHLICSGSFSKIGPTVMRPSPRLHSRKKEILTIPVDLLDLYDVEYPDIVEDAIDKLVMRPETNKDTIKAIAKTYTEGSGQYKAFAADFIQGKGEGQIILLHGPPGTGKTLTAGTYGELRKMIFPG